MKKCRRFRALIFQSLDERISLDNEFRLEEHLIGCNGCRKLFEEASTLEEAFLRLPEPLVDRLDLNRSLRNIHQTLDQRMASRRRNRVWRKVLQFGTPAAALLLGVVVAFNFQAADKGSAQAELAKAGEGNTWIGKNSGFDFGNNFQDSIQDQLDRLRLEGVRLQVKGFLQESFRFIPPGAEKKEVFTSVDQFDLLTKDLSRKGWPVRRIVGGFLADEDVQVARWAARYLGIRGDRYSVERLKKSLRREEFKHEVILALGDLGEAGIQGLRLALQDPDLTKTVLDQLSRTPGSESALVVESAIRKALQNQEAAGDQISIKDYLTALASMGEFAVPSLLHLGQEEPSLENKVLDTLNRIPGASKTLVRICQSDTGNFELRFLLKAVGRLQTGELLPWVEKLCLQGKYKVPALACLGKFDGEDPVRILLRLYHPDWLEDESLELAVRSMINRDSKRLRRIAEEMVRDGDSFQGEKFLELLIAVGSGATASAISRLAASDFLADEERQWAALAVGERGGLEDADLFIQTIDSLGPGQHRLAAAYLVSAYSLAGEGKTASVLNALSPRSQAKVASLLQENKSEEVTAASFFKLARELKPYLSLRDSKTWRFLQ